MTHLHPTPFLMNTATLSDADAECIIGCVVSAWMSLQCAKTHDEQAHAFLQYALCAHNAVKLIPERLEQGVTHQGFRIGFARDVVGSPLKISPIN